MCCSRPEKEKEKVPAWSVTNLDFCSRNKYNMFLNISPPTVANTSCGGSLHIRGLLIIYTSHQFTQRLGDVFCLLLAHGGQTSAGSEVN